MQRLRYILITLIAMVSYTTAWGDTTTSTVLFTSTGSGTSATGYCKANTYTSVRTITPSDINASATSTTIIINCTRVSDWAKISVSTSATDGWSSFANLTASSDDSIAANTTKDYVFSVSSSGLTTLSSQNTYVLGCGVTINKVTLIQTIPSSITASDPTTTYSPHDGDGSVDVATAINYYNADCGSTATQVGSYDGSTYFNTSGKDTKITVNYTYTSGNGDGAIYLTTSSESATGGTQIASKTSITDGSSVEFPIDDTNLATLATNTTYLWGTNITIKSITITQTFEKTKTETTKDNGDGTVTVTTTYTYTNMVCGSSGPYDTHYNKVDTYGALDANATSASISVDYTGSSGIIRYNTNGSNVWGTAITTSFPYTFSSTDLTTLKASSSYLYAYQATINSVTITQTRPAETHTTTRVGFTGSMGGTDTWTTGQELKSSMFDDAEAGDILRFYYTIGTSGLSDTYVSIYTTNVSSPTGRSDYGYYASSYSGYGSQITSGSSSCELTLTSDMITALQAAQQYLAVYGNSVTINRVAVIHSSTIGYTSSGTAVLSTVTTAGTTGTYDDNKYTRITSIAADNFSKNSTLTKIVVNYTYSGSGDASFYLTTSSESATGTTQIGYATTSNGITSGTNTIIFDVTDNIATLTANATYLYGYNITINSVYIEQTITSETLWEGTASTVASGSMTSTTFKLGDYVYIDFEQGTGFSNSTGGSIYVKFTSGDGLTFSGQREGPLMIWIADADTLEWFNSGFSVEAGTTSYINLTKIRRIIGDGTAPTKIWAGLTVWNSSGDVTDSSGKTTTHTGDLLSSGALPTFSSDDVKAFTDANLDKGDKLLFYFELPEGKSSGTIGINYTASGTLETFNVNISPFKLLVTQDRLKKMAGGFSISGATIQLDYIGAIQDDDLETLTIWDDEIESAGSNGYLPNGSLYFDGIQGTTLKEGDVLHFEYSLVNSTSYASIALWSVSTSYPGSILSITNPSTTGKVDFVIYDDADLSDYVVTRLHTEKFNIALTNIKLTKVYLTVNDETRPVTPTPTGTMTSDGEKVYTTADYSTSTSNIPNPERGVMHQVVWHSYNTNAPHQVRDVKNWHRQENKTIVRFVVYLDNYESTTTIPQSYIDSIKSELKNLRAGGAKCIMRFAYNEGDNSSNHTNNEYIAIKDASLATIQAHISQLKTEIFDNYSDVICLVEAGFIGAWGEWFYTEDNDSKTNRAAVLNALLDALPTDRFISVRTPMYKYNVLGSGYTDTTTSDEAYDGSDYSRIGAHNDAFISSDNDYGTYGADSRNKGITSAGADNDKAFWAADTKYGPMGGETSSTSAVETYYTKTLSELATYHYSYMDEDWYNGFVEKWEATPTTDDSSSPSYADNDTYWNTMEKRLGYRFAVTQAQMTNSVEGPLHIQFTIRNDGYATPFNPRPMKVVLLSEDSENSGSYTYVADLDVSTNHDDGSPANINTDPRKWYVENVEGDDKGITTVQMWLDVNSLIKDGKITSGNTYVIGIELPDENSTLAKNDWYSIRFANKNTWVEVSDGTNTRGINLLGSITIGNALTHDVGKTTWASWATTKPCQDPSDAYVYIVTAATALSDPTTGGAQSTGTVTLTAVTDAPADAPVILHDDDATQVVTHTFPVIRASDVANYSTVVAATPNKLHYIGDGYTNESGDKYVLYNGDSGVGFYLWSGTDFASGSRQVYLPASVVVNGASSTDAGAKPYFIPLSYDGTTTGIQGVKAFDNGQNAEEFAGHDDGGRLYNLQGQRVGGSYRGIVIRNGKKYYQR